MVWVLHKFKILSSKFCQDLKQTFANSEDMDTIPQIAAFIEEGPQKGSLKGRM